MKRHAALGRNAARSRRLHQHNFGPRGEAVRAMPCAVAAKHGEDQAGPSWDIRALLEAGHQPEDLACSGDVQAAHVARARGMGGMNSSSRALAPLCAHHHHQAGERRTPERKRFRAIYDINLIELAAKIAEELDAKGLP